MFRMVPVAQTVRRPRQEVVSEVYDERQKSIHPSPRGCHSEPSRLTSSTHPSKKKIEVAARCWALLLTFWRERICHAQRCGRSPTFEKPSQIDEQKNDKNKKNSEGRSQNQSLRVSSSMGVRFLDVVVVMVVMVVVMVVGMVVVMVVVIVVVMVMDGGGISSCFCRNHDFSDVGYCSVEDDWIGMKAELAVPTTVINDHQPFPTTTNRQHDSHSNR